MTIEFLSSSVQDTRRLGARLAGCLQAGDVVLLYGDMGAGKSELCRGIAKGLGISGPIPSPTFTILQAYEDGRLPLYHFDWYRLESSEELFEMGMEEYLGGDGVALVEWPTKAKAAIPKTYLEARMLRSGEDHQRKILLTPVGGFHKIELGEGQ